MNGGKGLLGTLMLITASVLLANVAIAQEATSRRAQPRRVDIAIEDALYGRGGTFFQNRQPPRNFTWLLGPFPENDIAADGRAVHRVYRQAILQQALGDPIIRTPDLTNPYDTSILLLPTTELNTRSTSSESVNETPIFPSTTVPPAPVPVQETRPVPALY